MNLDDLLQAVASGELNPQVASKRITAMTTARLDFATIDHDRAERCGSPEVIFAQNKTAHQVVKIAEKIVERSGHVLITRAKPEHVDALHQASTLNAVKVGDLSGTVLVGEPPRFPQDVAPAIPIITAGTSDMPVAEEAAMTCEAMGQAVHVINDVGVAGLHRIVGRLEEIRRGRVVIVCAGMEGALPSVVGGLVKVPVIAVPTSVGYGASFGGLAALLGMLNSCASGVVTVNIDNGFGAALTACRINAPSWATG